MVTRIAGGVLKGRLLRTVRSRDLRPTAERVRAALFSILGDEVIRDARVLDLFAGTGALGIEALSRGAMEVDFVESHRGRARDIRRNLQELRLCECGRVHNAKIPMALDFLGGGYDLIFLDPPYGMECREALLSRLGDLKLLSETGLVAIEYSSRRPINDSHVQLTRLMNRTYGDTAISLYETGEMNG